MKLNRECFNKIVSVLTPFMQDENVRQAILQSSLYDIPVINQIRFSGDASTFTTLLIQRLDNYGRIADEKTAVVAILETVKQRVGIDKQREINELIICASGNEEKVSDSKEVKDIPDLPHPTNDEAKDYIFISYSSIDRVSIVDRLAKDLSNLGYKIWVDNLDRKFDGLIAGRNWQQSLANAINQSKIVIFVITPDSIRSKWTQAELKRAGEADLPVVGVITRSLRTKEDKSIFAQIKVGHSSISDLHHRDFTTIGYDKGLEMLKLDLQNLIEA